MKRLDDSTIVLRSLRARPFATITTVLTVAVAVALLMVILSMRESGKNAFSKGTGNMDLLITKDESPLTSVLNNVYYAGVARAPIHWNQYTRIDRSYPFEYAIPLAYGDNYRGNPAVATIPEFFEYFQPVEGVPWSFAEGGVFTEHLDIVIGDAVARRTGLELGDILSVTHGSGEGAHVHKEFPFKVVGILNPTGSAHDRALFTSLESAWVLHAHDRRLRDEGDDISITTPDDLIEADELITAIYARVMRRGVGGVSAGLPQIFDQLRKDSTVTVASPADEVRKLFIIVGGVDGILIGMALAVLASSGIAVMLALINSTEQRRRQIATLRVLGFSRGRIFRIVMTEASMLGLAGAVVGFLASLIAGTIVSQVMRDRLGLVIEPTLQPKITLAVIVGTVLLCAVAGLAPAANAYRISVLRSLRPTSG